MAEGEEKALLQKLVRITIERNCGRLACWNQPGMTLYKSLDPAPIEEWITCHLTGDTLYRLAEQRET